MPASKVEKFRIKKFKKGGGGGRVKLANLAISIQKSAVVVFC